MLCTTFRSDFHVGWKNQNNYSTLNLSFDDLSKRHDQQINVIIAILRIKAVMGHVQMMYQWTSLKAKMCLNIISIAAYEGAITNPLSDSCKSYLAKLPSRLQNWHFFLFFKLHWVPMWLKMKVRIPICLFSLPEENLHIRWVHG